MTSRRVWLFVVPVSLLVFGFNDLSGADCSWDTSYCAYSTAKNGYYAGTLRDPYTNQAVTDRTVRVYVESRGDYDFTIHTDHGGRYCFVWAEEAIFPAAHLRPNLDASLRDWYSFQDGPAPPPGCQRIALSIPWNRARGLTSRWQYEAVLWLSIAALVVVVSGSLALSEPVKLRSRALSAALTFVALGLCIAVWS